MHARRMGVAVVAHCALFVSVLLPPEVAASEGVREAKPLAEIAVGASRVDWQPTIDYEHVVLTVAGPGDLYISKEFGAGQPPSFELFDSRDNPLPDGTYSYELRLTPRQKAETGPPLRHSGYLAVRGGSFVTMDSPEARGVTPRSPVKQITAEQIISEGVCIGDLCTTGDEGFPLRLKDDLSQLILDGDNPNILFKDDTPGGFSADHSFFLSANQLFNSAEFFTLGDAETNNKLFTVEGDAPDASLYIRSNGNLGLGTSTPAQDVHAMSGNTPALRLDQDTSGGLSARTWDLGANNTELFVKDVTGSSAVPFRIKAGAPSDTLVVASDGRVGIGTASPSTVRLDVRSNIAGNATARLQNSSASGYPGIEYLDNAGNVGLYFGLDNANGTTRFNSINSKPIVVLTNSSERMRVTSAGDIGIGTASPSSRLHVNGGDIRVSGGSFIDDGVTLNAPDYVFEPSYSLMPLAELREFVSREKHLPNVPAAADIKKEGLNLSQFQMRLLEKIEELALYTLQQEEGLQSLRDENRELKARLEALEKAQASGEQR